MPSEVEYAWLAGLFEGEGYIAFSKGRPKRLTIEMTDLDILQRVLSTFGGVLYEPKSRNPKWKKTWVWSISGEDSRNLVKKLLPFFGERRKERAEEYLRSHRTRKEYQEIRKMKAEERHQEIIKLRNSGLTHQKISDILGMDRASVTKILNSHGLRGPMGGR